MKVPEAAPGQTMITTVCWSCGGELYKSVPRRRRGPGHVLWSCEECAVAWSAPVAAAGLDQAA